MKQYVLALLILSSLSSFAKAANCTVFTLGAGADNIGVYNQKVEMETSPSGEAFLGSVEFDLPEVVPVENRKVEGVENTYKVKINLKSQKGTSKWVRGASSLKGNISVYAKGVLSVYHEATSNSLHNPSDKRVIDAGKVVGLNTKIKSLEYYKKIKKMGHRELNVLGVELTVDQLVSELGLGGASEHLAAQGVVSSEELVGWQINCSE